MEVIRIRPGSSRFYVLFDARDALRARLCAFAKKWKEEAELIDLRS